MMSQWVLNSTEVLGYPVSSQGLGANVSWTFRLLEQRTSCRHIACANPHSLITAQSDPDGRNALMQADVLLPDGFGIILAGKLQKTPFTERVAGSEFFHEFSRQANQRGGVRYFFLGSTDAVLEKICRRLKKDFPSIEIAGSYSPPFKEEFDAQDNQQMLKAVNESRADVLWVGMTALKQEKWIHANKAQLEVPLACAIGAVFDFYAGNKKRAPHWMGRIGLEWLPRLLREPRRLWRRNFVSTPLFLQAVIRQSLCGRSK